MTPKTAALILCAPIPAMAIGAWTAQLSGISYAAYAPNAVAYVIGLILVLTAKYWLALFRRHALVISIFVLLLIAWSLFSPGLQGVHRWIRLGPFSLNVSMAFMPLILAGMAFQPVLGALLLSAVTAILHFLQPDAGQLGVFAPAASAIFALQNTGKLIFRIGGGAVAFILLVMTILRPDPLQPVEHVERILHLAYSHGAGLFIAAVVSILLLLFPVFQFLRGKLNSQHGVLAQSLFTFLCMSFVVTEIRSCPVPVIGAGAAPVIGWFLATILASPHEERT